jgi:hypothetical protein
MSELAPPPEPRVRRGQRLEALRRSEQQIARLQAEQRLLIAQLYREDLGGMHARYVRDELSLVWRRSSRQCQRRIDDALVFADFPAVHALIGDGTWLMDHADAAIDELARTGLSHDEQRQVLELVLSRRVHLTPWEVRQAVRTAAVVLFPQQATDRAQQAENDRDVRVHDEEPGVASLLAHGPAHLVAAMMAALDAACGPADPTDPRTRAQRRFDTLLALVCGQITPANWQVHVLTCLTTLRGEDELPGEVVGHGPVPAEQARELAAQGVLRRVQVHQDGTLAAVDTVTHRPDLTPEPEPIPEPTPVPDVEVEVEVEVEVAVAVAGADTEAFAQQPDPSDEAPSEDDLRWYAGNRPPLPDERPPGFTGGRPAYLRTWWSDTAFRTALQRLATDPVRPVDLSTDKYVAPKPLKRHLELRDRTCVFPGCPRRATDCDKDHLIPWPRGSTSEPNLASECQPHHIAKHEHFTVERLSDGTFRWTSPTGITADRPPRPVLDAWTYRPPSR